MARTVDTGSTFEQWRQNYNDLATDVGDTNALTTGSKDSLVNAINYIQDQYFFFQDFDFDGSDGASTRTVFSGADNSGNTLQYAAQKVLVYKNGLLLRSGTDYIAINGTSVTLTASAGASDVIRISSYTGSYTATPAGQESLFNWQINGANIYNSNTGSSSGIVFNADKDNVAALVTAPTVANSIQFEGNVYHNGTITVGVDGTGHDVKFFGDTAGASLLWDQSADTLRFSDGTYLKIGTGDDLQIYHNGSDSFIKDTGTGSLIISSNQLSIQKSNNTEALAVFNEDGDVKLYYNDALKIATVTGGINVTGDTDTDTLTVSGNATVGGTLGVTGVATFSAVPVLPANTIDSAHYVDGSIDTEHYADNSVGASAINVSGNGTNGYALISDGDGSMSWAAFSGSDTTYSQEWVDSSDDVILRLNPSAGGNDDLTMVAGTGITLTPSGDNMTIAATAGTPTVITVADTTDTTSFVSLFESATGDLGPKTDAGLTYNAGTGMLTATGFTGPLTGNVTGNASGTAATVTGGTQSSITSAANLVTVGTITTGTWQGTAINQTYLVGQSGTNTGDQDTVDMGSGFKIRDDDNDDVTITENQYLKFVVQDGGAFATNVTGAGSTGDPYTMTITAPFEAAIADTNTTYSTSWVDSSTNAILRLTPSSGSADDLTMVAGTGITLTPSGDNLTIASTTYSVGDGGLTQNNFTNTLKTKLDGIATSATANTGTVDTSGSPVDNDFAKFTDANTIEGRSYAEVRSDLNVANGATANTGTTTATSTETFTNKSGNISQWTNNSGYSTTTGTVDTSGSPVDNDFAKFTDANTIEGRSYAEVKTDLSLNNVENTAISTFAGSSNITTVGTIGTGTWEGTAINQTYLTGQSGTNTGDQTTVSGNAGTATTLATARTIGSVSFDGSANIVPQTIQVLDESSDTTCFVAFFPDATGNLLPKTGTNLTFNSSSGLLSTTSITATGDITSNTSSDMALKENIINIPNPLEKLSKIGGYMFDWKDHGYTDVHGKGHDTGILAQEIEEILPEIVNTRESGIKAVNYMKLIPLLIESIKELKNEVESLKDSKS